LSVEFAVENLFPWAKVEFAAGYGNNDFPPHYLPFQVGVGVYFAGVVAVGGNRLMGREFLKPDVKIVVKAGLIVIYKDTGCDVHCVCQAQSFLNTGFS
jgi:hypothetical protein